VGENADDEVVKNLSKDFQVIRVLNFKELSDAAKKSKSDNMLIVKSSLRRIDKDAIFGLASYLSKEGVGITSLKSLYSQNNLVMGLGLVVSKNNVTYAMHYSQIYEEGLSKRGAVVNNFIAPIQEIFAIKRGLFLELNGISDAPFSQLELALKALELGKRTVIMPDLVAYFEEPFKSGYSAFKRVSVSKELSRVLTKYDKFIVSDADIFFNSMINSSFNDFDY
jgi:hypothetical protein